MRSGYLEQIYKKESRLQETPATNPSFAKMYDGYCNLASRLMSLNSGLVKKLQKELLSNHAAQDQMLPLYKKLATVSFHNALDDIYTIYATNAVDADVLPYLRQLEIQLALALKLECHTTHPSSVTAPEAVGGDAVLHGALAEDEDGASSLSSLGSLASRASLPIGAGFGDFFKLLEDHDSDASSVASSSDSVYSGFDPTTPEQRLAVFAAQAKSGKPLSEGQLIAAHGLLKLVHDREVGRTQTVLTQYEKLMETPQLRAMELLHKAVHAAKKKKWTKEAKDAVIAALQVVSTAVRSEM